MLIVLHLFYRQVTIELQKMHQLLIWNIIWDPQKGHLFGLRIHFSNEDVMPVMEMVPDHMVGIVILIDEANVLEKIIVY